MKAWFRVRSQEPLEISWLPFALMQIPRTSRSDSILLFACLEIELPISRGVAFTISPS